MKQLKSESIDPETMHELLKIQIDTLSWIRSCKTVAAVNQSARNVPSGMICTCTKVDPERARNLRISCGFAR